MNKNVFQLGGNREKILQLQEIISNKECNGDTGNGHSQEENDTIILFAIMCVFLIRPGKRGKDTI